VILDTKALSAVANDEPGLFVYLAKRQALNCRPSFSANTASESRTRYAAISMKAGSKGSSPQPGFWLSVTKHPSITPISAPSSKRQAALSRQTISGSPLSPANTELRS
jgi:hypothetical protein